MAKPLRVMKFGGTSMGDAECIARSAKIVVEGARDASIVVVVSAMSGVTNRLIASATRAQTGDADAGPELVEALRKQHQAALQALIGNNGTRRQVQEQMEAILAEARRLYDGTALLRELSPRTLDSISSLGERLSAPVFSATLAAMGVKSEPVEATRLIVTDSYHGGAEPLADLTREHCEQCLRPMLKEGAVPVVTGFIGSSESGCLHCMR